MPSAFIGESEPERRFLMRRFAPKRPFGTGSGASAAGGGGEFWLFGSSLSERFSLAAAGILRLGHEGARNVNMFVTRALSCCGNFTGYLTPFTSLLVSYRSLAREQATRGVSPPRGSAH